MSSMSWDAVSFKVSPSSSEIFCYKNPDMVAKLDPQHLTLIDKVEGLMAETI